jgi:hypothetical protein
MPTTREEDLLKESIMSAKTHILLSATVIVTAVSISFCASAREVGHRGGAARSEAMHSAGHRDEALRQTERRNVGAAGVNARRYGPAAAEGAAVGAARRGYGAAAEGAAVGAAAGTAAAGAAAGNAAGVYNAVGGAAIGNPPPPTSVPPNCVRGPLGRLVCR